MRSVADQIREDQRAALLALTPEARAEYALAAGRQVLEAFAAAQGLDRAAAQQRLRDNAQHGRTHSACMRARRR